MNALKEVNLIYLNFPKASALDKLNNKDLLLELLLFGFSNVLIFLVSNLFFE